MDAVWRDSLKFNLERAYNFWKPAYWTDGHVREWLLAMSGYGEERITQGFNDYFKVGKFMPKPADIIKLIQDVGTPAHVEFEQEEYKKCDPVIASAWRIYLGTFLGWPFGDPELAIDHDEVIEIVNREAARTNQPGAVRPEHRIEKYWDGKNYDPDQWWRENSFEHQKLHAQGKF